MGFLTKFTKHGVEFNREPEITKKKDKKKSKRITKMKKKSRKINQKRKKVIYAIKYLFYKGDDPNG